MNKTMKFNLANGYTISVDNYEEEGIISLVNERGYVVSDYKLSDVEKDNLKYTLSN